MHPHPLPENPLHLPADKLTLGCPVLDAILGGGIPCGSITELVAESSAGKTQLCLQLLLRAPLPPSVGGLSSPSLYLYSEPPFPLRRLLRLSPSPSLLPFVFIRPAPSPDDLLALLGRLPDHPPVRLIVVDSIAALFRADFDNSPQDLRRRSNLFFKIAGALKERARRLGAAVVVTNQVVDVLEGEGLWTSGRRVAPALGLAWSHCVNTRVFLSRIEEVVGEREERARATRTRRRMQVVFAPHLPQGSCEFLISGDGVFGVSS